MQTVLVITPYVVQMSPVTPSPLGKEIVTECPVGGLTCIFTPTAFGEGTLGIWRRDSLGAPFGRVTHHGGMTSHQAGKNRPFVFKDTKWGGARPMWASLKPEYERIFL